LPYVNKRTRTRERIVLAAAEVYHEFKTLEHVTFTAVSQRARVAEMTVFRHFPKRELLLRALWDHLDRSFDNANGIPDSELALLERQSALFRAFDKIPAQILASIGTTAGRAARTASNHEIRQAFLSLVDEVAPALSAAEKTRVAAILQLLHSPYAWASLRDQWGLSGRAGCLADSKVRTISRATSGMVIA
jgi:AcrR family transcriptional regulator